MNFADMNIVIYEEAQKYLNSKKIDVIKGIKQILEKQKENYRFLKLNFREY